MAGEIQLVIVGNTTADVELRYSQNGKAIGSFTVANTPRTFDRQTNEWKEGQATFIRCTAWGDLGEHCAATLSKGDRVIVQGRFSQRSYTDREGAQRTSYDLEVDEIGPSLKWATAQVTRTGGNKNQAGNAEKFRQQQNGGMRPGTAGDQPWSPNQGQQQGGQQQGQQPQGDVWSTDPQFDDETPF